VRARREKEGPGLAAVIFSPNEIGRALDALQHREAIQIVFVVRIWNSAVEQRLTWVTLQR
jgi:hypothetical protein